MPGPVRDAERTRARLLAAAAEAIGEGGPAVSLAVVARKAGVSKGGLLHHFPTREELLAALMTHLLEQFEALLDHELTLEHEGQPGRRTRAYVRAVFADLANGERAREQLTLMGMIGSSAAVSEVLRLDDEHWKERIAQDGIDPLRAEVIMKAADGATASLMWSRNPPEHYARLRDLLLEMTYETGPLAVGTAL